MPFEFLKAKRAKCLVGPELEIVKRDLSEGKMCAAASLKDN